MLEDVTIGMLQKWREALNAHCCYGKENFCDGKPTDRHQRRRRVCKYYDEERKKCTQPKIAKCKQEIRIYLSGERKQHGKNN